MEQDLTRKAVLISLASIVAYALWQLLLRQWFCHPLRHIPAVKVSRLQCGSISGLKFSSNRSSIRDIISWDRHPDTGSGPIPLCNYDMSLTLFAEPKSLQTKTW